jgi:micrococcal nuclease
MYEYAVTIKRIVDGDTVDVDIDLGFGVVLANERVRIMGIDTPESRTRDLLEKKFGLAAKQKLKEILGKKAILKCEKYDAKGKFGRILGDFSTADGQMATKILIETGHAVAYFGGSKDEVQAKHMVNREKLLREGVVTL